VPVENNAPGYCFIVWFQRLDGFVSCTEIKAEMTSPSLETD